MSRRAVDIKLFIHIHIHCFSFNLADGCHINKLVLYCIHRTQMPILYIGLRVSLCTEYPQSADGFY